MAMAVTAAARMAGAHIDEALVLQKLKEKKAAAQAGGGGRVADCDDEGGGSDHEKDTPAPSRRDQNTKYLERLTHSVLRAAHDLYAEDDPTLTPIFLPSREPHPKLKIGTRVVDRRYGVAGTLLGYVSNGKQVGTVDGGLERESQQGARVNFDAMHPDMASHSQIQSAAEMFKAVGRKFEPPPWNLDTQALVFEQSPETDNVLAPLISAIVHDNPTELERLLSNGHSPQASTDMKGPQPLWLACNSGKSACALALLKAGADAKATHKTISCLFASARGGHADIAAELINHGADVNATTTKGHTPLWIAAIKRHVEVVRLLVAQRADPNMADEDPNISPPARFTPLMVGCICGTFDGPAQSIVQMLISARSDIQQHSGIRGMTATCLVSALGRAQPLQMLIASGACDLEVGDDSRNTPCQLAAYHNQPQTLKVLIEARCDLECLSTTGSGSTALVYAAQFGNLECMRELLEAGAEVSKTAGNGLTALMMTSNNRVRDCISLDCLKLLLKHGALITTGGNEEMEGSHRENPLQLSCKQGDAAAVELVLSHARALFDKDGAIEGKSMEEFYEQQDAQGATPLSWASQSGYTSIAKALLDFGFKTDKPNGRGGYPLALAVTNDNAGSHLETVKLLLARGADIEQGDAEGDAVLTRALLKGNLAMANLVLEHDGNVEHVNAIGLTPLDLMVRMGKREETRFLLEHGALVSESTIHFSASERSKQGGCAELIAQKDQIREEGRRRWQAARAAREQRETDEKNRAELVVWLTDAFAESGVHVREVDPCAAALTSRDYLFTSVQLVADLAVDEDIDSKLWPKELSMVVRRAIRKAASKASRGPQSPGGGLRRKTASGREQKVPGGGDALKRAASGGAAKATPLTNVDTIIDELEREGAEVVAKMHGRDGVPTINDFESDDRRIFDKALIGALHKGLIRVIQVGFLLKTPETWIMPMLQEMREIPGALVEPSKAAALLMRGNRSIIALSHCWLTKDHPDPRGEKVRVVQEYLQRMRRSGQLPEDAAVFWDYGSLPQKPPGGSRSADDERTFQTALAIMAYVYASPLGTSVLQLRYVPSRPKDDDGRLIVDHLPAGTTTAELKAVMEKYGTIVGFNRASPTSASAELRYASHSQAEIAAAAVSQEFGGAAFACLQYNDLPYDDRGWCTAEQIFSTECLLCMQNLPKDLERPKVAQLSETNQLTTVVPTARSSAEVAQLIRGKTFMGKGDLDTVMKIYQQLKQRLLYTYRFGEETKITNVMDDPRKFRNE